MYLLYLRVSGKIHKIVAILDRPYGYDILCSGYKYKVSYSDYLKAYAMFEDELVAEVDKDLKYFWSVNVRIFWKFFVAGLIFGGILRPHYYLLGAIAYLVVRYAQHYVIFVRVGEPMLSMQRMSMNMMDDYFEKHGLKKVKKRIKQPKVRSGA